MKEVISIDVDKKVNDFLDATLPNYASEVQTRETKKAFIAGMLQSKTDMIVLSSLDSDFAIDYIDEYYNNIDNAARKNILEDQ